MGDAGWAAGPDFADAYRRRKHRYALDTHLHEWMRGWEKLELEGCLQVRGVAAAGYRSQGDRYLDPQLKAREAWVEVEHPALGTEPLYGDPIRMRRRHPAPMRRAPMLGEHDTQVLRDWLGMGDVERERHATAGVLS